MISFKENNKKYRDISLRIGIALISLYNFTWLCIGAFYSYPTTEDLTITAMSRDNGTINAAVDMLLTYDGRYTTNILHGINPLVFDMYYAYKIVPIFTFFLLILTLYMLFNELFIHKKKLDNFIFAFAFVTLFFSILNLATTFYWMICTFVYIYPVIFFLLFYRAFLIFKRKPKKKYFTYSIIFLILSLGCCELHIPIFGFILLIILYSERHDALLKKINIRFLFIYMASSLLFITSPGITFRFNRYENTRFDNWSDLFLKAGKFTIEEFNTSGSLALLLFIFIFASTHLNKIKYKQKILTFFLGVAMVYLTWVSMVYLKNDGYPSRIASVPVSMAILSTLFICSHETVQKLLVKYQGFIFISFLLSSIFLDNSFSSIRKDYTNGTMSKYKELMDENYSILNQNKDKQDCYSTATIHDVLPHLPLSIAIDYLVIPPDRKDNRWNKGYEVYFKIDEVRLENDTITILKQINEKIH